MARVGLYKRVLNVVVTEEMHQNVKQITDQLVISINEFVRQAVEEKLERDGHISGKTTEPSAVQEELLGEEQ